MWNCTSLSPYFLAVSPAFHFQNLKKQTLGPSSLCMDNTFTQVLLYQTVIYTPFPWLLNGFCWYPSWFGWICAAIDTRMRPEDSVTHGKRGWILREAVHKESLPIQISLFGGTVPTSANRSRSVQLWIDHWTVSIAILVLGLLTYLLIYLLTYLLAHLLIYLLIYLLIFLLA